MEITRTINTRVFFVPMTLLITSILGRLRAGPARSRASAGPCPIPLPRSPCSMGISVRVAKYMNAPATDANRFALREFPPTAFVIQREGISPSCSGLPRRKPAISTPAKRRGMICLENISVDDSYSFVSLFPLLVIPRSPTMPAVKGTEGFCLKIMERKITASTTGVTFSHPVSNHTTRMKASRSPQIDVINHLCMYMKCYRPSVL